MRANGSFFFELLKKRTKWAVHEGLTKEMKEKTNAPISIHISQTFLSHLQKSQGGGRQLDILGAQIIIFLPCVCLDFIMIMNLINVFCFFPINRLIWTLNTYNCLKNQMFYNISTNTYLNLFSLQQQKYV